MSLTKNTKPKADYHTWSTAEVADGDIIGIADSLGHPGKVTIESLGGQTTFRINVSHKIFERQTTANPWLADAAFYTRPLEVTEVELAKDDIIIESGATWYSNEIPISDIKVITKATNIKITAL